MKRNKERRAYLKRFSSEVVNTGGAARLDKYHVRELYGASSMIGTPPSSKFNSYATPIPETVTKVEMPWQSENYNQGVDRYQYIICYDFGHKVLRLYFCGDKWFYWKKNREEIKVSMIYEGQERARTALKSHKIVWFDPQTQG